MFPSLQQTVNRYGESSSQPVYPSPPANLDSAPGQPSVPLGQECTESPSWYPSTPFTYVDNHFDEPRSDSGTADSTNGQHSKGKASKPEINKRLVEGSSLLSERNNSQAAERNGQLTESKVSETREKKKNSVTRVQLSKAPNGSRESTSKFYVRAAGGMGIISEPDPPSERPTKSHSAPQFKENDDTTMSTTSPMTLSDTTSPSAVDSVLAPRPPVSGGFPLSVGLIAGRGVGEGSSKGRSVPPSHTLAMSANFLKSYFISSSDKDKQPAKSASANDPETSVKTKVMGIWNNVKYGWTVNLKTSFSRDSPVYLLGRVYHKSLGEDQENCEAEALRHGMEAFKSHFHSLVWCTYRRQFPTLQDSSLTTDCGWGCMLRSGQMMLATALTTHFLTRDWRWNKSGAEAPEDWVHRSIIRWFGDSPSPHCPLSLHNLVHFGHKLGKKAGDWYGPASVAYIFKEAVEMGSKYIADLKGVCVYVAQDCAVYIQDVLDLCFTPCVCHVGELIQGRDIVASRHVHQERLTNHITRVTPPNSHIENGREWKAESDVRLQQEGSSRKGALRYNSSNVLIVNCNVPRGVVGKLGGKGREEGEGVSSTELCGTCDNWRSVLLMVPVRLGGDCLNPIYAPCIYSLFTHDLFAGIIGGRPKHSLYFVGFQEESLIHLDPHLCQDVVGVTQPSFPLASYHCTSPRKMSLSRMDPSATLGFYCHTRTDFLRLMEELPELVTPKQPGFEYPIFEFVDGRCEDMDALTRQVSCEDARVAQLPPDTPLLPQDSEEFVFL